MQFAVACVSAGCANSRACSCYGLNSEPTNRPTNSRQLRAPTELFFSFSVSFLLLLISFFSCSRSSFLMNFIHRRRHRRERARDTHTTAAAVRDDVAATHRTPHETSPPLLGASAQHTTSHTSRLFVEYMSRKERESKWLSFPKKKKTKEKQNSPRVLDAARALSRT